MRIYLSSAVLASIISPVVSFSYLESLGGVKTNPVAFNPPAAAVPANGASYLDALSGNAPAPPVAAAAAAPPAPVAAPPAPVAAAAAPSSGTVAQTSSAYMDALSTGASTTSGPGLLAYKDALPVSTSVGGGAGIPTYTASLPSANTIAAGPGLISHTDNLSGGKVGSIKSKPSAPSASSASSATSGNSPVDFTLETSNLSGLVERLNGGNTVTLSGSIDSVSFH